MVWKAKVTGIATRVAPVSGEVTYDVSVEFYDYDDPAVKYTKRKQVPYTVTKNQVLNAIKADLVELNAGAVLTTVVSPRIGEEIDENTTW